MNHLPLTGTVKAIWKQSGNVSSSFLRIVSVKLVAQLHDVATGRRIKSVQKDVSVPIVPTNSLPHIQSLAIGKIP